jgi:DNA-binding SARP family transcriptional activator
MARLSICLLGPLQVTLDGAPVTAFESDKVRALLAFLVVEANSPHRREKLAGLLWPEMSERAARANLRHILANLRQAIGDRQADPPFLHITRQTVQFNSASDAWIDAIAFSERLEAAASARKAQGSADPRAIQRLEETLQLCRGGFLEGFSLPDSPDFEEWLLYHQERYLHLTLQALERLLKHYQERGEYERALPHARRVVELDPWREEARRRLMHLLALSGQRAGAISQYELCRRAVAQELGLEPEAETTALYERIKAGMIAPPPRREGLPLPPHNLPASLTAFVGREAELLEIKERLQDPVCRLLTVVGPGGIGKTRLALQAVRELLGSSASQTLFPQGVFFVPLASVGGVDALSPTIAGALGLSLYRETNPIPGPPAEVDAKAQLLSYLREKALLLVLDNFEHLLEGVHLVIELLRAAPALKVLVTSRESLDVRGE